MIMGRSELIACGLPLVRAVARTTARRLPYWVDVGDLVGAGHEGLLHAVDCYDEAKGELFEPYARVKIRCAVFDSLRAEDCLTRYARRWVVRKDKLVHRLRHELGHDPSEPDVAERLGLSLEDYQRTLGQVGFGWLHIDADGCADKRNVLAEDVVAQDELHAQLRAAVARLSPRRQRAIELYYWHERTQLEIARELGVTESRVCQILSESEAALRAVLAPDAPKRRSRWGTNRAYNNLRAEAAE